MKEKIDIHQIRRSIPSSSVDRQRKKLIRALSGLTETFAHPNFEKKSQFTTAGQNENASEGHGKYDHAHVRAHRLIEAIHIYCFADV